MKKKIIIVGDRMNSVGVPAALAGLLKDFDFSRYDVTLLLDDSSGPWMNRIPEEVHIKELKIKNKLLYAWVLWVNPYKGRVPRLLFQVYRKLFRTVISLLKIRPEKLYEFVIKHTEKIEEEYDVALHFRGDRKFMAQFTTKGISAKKAAQWIHDERIKNRNDIYYDIGYFDKFFCVSASLKSVFDTAYPEYANRSEVCYNQVDVSEVIQKSKSEITDERFTGEYKIVTTGRMAHVKGYDIAVDAAKLLKDRGLSFKWFFIGDGVMYNDIKNKLKTYDLENEVILLGSKANPMPYVAGADMYVQPSRSEGYCLSLLEARILNKVIIATDLPVFKEQIVDGETGILSELNADAFAKQIERVMRNPGVAEHLVENLKNEVIDFSPEMDKIYNYIG